MPGKPRVPSQRQWLRMFGAIMKIRSVSTLSISVLVKRSGVSSYLRRLSLRFLLKRKLLHIRENGPGGIRTRIYDCDRVLCSPYTTGPACSVPGLAQDRKAMRHNSCIRVSNWKYGGSSEKPGTVGTFPLSCSRTVCLVSPSWQRPSVRYFVRLLADGCEVGASVS